MGRRVYGDTHVGNAAAFFGLDKEDIKRLINEAIASAAAFFGLGNKKAVKACGKVR